MRCFLKVFTLLFNDGQKIKNLLSKNEIGAC